VTVFLKGCPLSCLWCHNPEGIAPAPGVLTVRANASAAENAWKPAPKEALSPGPDGMSRNREACTACGVCAEVCPALAHEAVGRKWTVAEVMAEIGKETPFFRRKSGRRDLFRRGAADPARFS
jgi:hypothetical protein